MRHRLLCLTFVLPMAMPSGYAAAQTVIAVADLPPIRMAPLREYGLRGLIDRAGKARSRKTAMLERLFAPAEGFGTSDHRHAATFAIGGIEVTGEAMREQVLSAGTGLDRTSRVIERVWAAGVHADWAVGADDSVSLGLAASKDKRAEPAILPGIAHIKGGAIATDLTWSHGAHLRMSLGWRADRSASPAAGAERLVEIAQGAALREQGARLTVGYLLAGPDASRRTMFGIAARDARIAADDLAAIGPFRRQDVQAAMFFRRSF